MPVSDKSCRSPRFSPVAGTPSLSRPRQASTATLESRKIARHAIHTTITSTSDIAEDESEKPHTFSAESATPPTPDIVSPIVPQMHPSSPGSLRSSAANDLEEDSDTIPEYQYELQDSWDYSQREEEEQDDLSMSESWTQEGFEAANECTSLQVGRELGGSFVKHEPVSPNVKSKSVNEAGEVDLKWFQLNALEQWIILHVRESRKDGISAAEGFYRLRDRCVEQSRRELGLMFERQHLLRRLKEINGLSGGFEPIRSSIGSSK
ncbi:hypothetical protein R3P38DRAFT_2802860 [Favolaschia claudopus]|uniref:Extracellular mutant protein 11 C-terminal domain-containing protein n=1 Tax=Favolaschia claudopus TaxID=2862362 RepID=A0AAV9ZUF9_9AGAR